MTSIKTLTALTLSACALAACSSLSSEDLDTDGMHADITIEAHGDGRTQVRASLRAGDAGSLTWVELDDGDRLFAQNGVERAQLSERNDAFEMYEYAAALDGDRPESPVRVELRRAQFADAKDSQATLPAPFTVRTEVGGRALVAGVDAVPLRWGQGSGDNVSVRISGDCLLDYDSGPMPDSGAVVLPPQALEPWSSDAAGESCVATVQVRRVRGGTLDPAFESGRITAAQVRAVPLRVVIR